MVGIKRTQKSQLRSHADNAARQNEIKDLLADILAYDSGAHFTEFKRLFKIAEIWSDRQFRKLNVSRSNNPFADPLLVVKYLVSCKADRETILAALLYPAISPLIHGGPLDTEGLTKIDHTFGRNVGQLVRSTLKLASLERLPLQEEFATQTRQQQLDEFLLMAMYLAEDPRAILLRGANRHIKQKLFLEAAAGALSRRQIDYAVAETREVLAPILYRVGYGDLRYRLLDGVARIEDPDKYAQTQHDIETVDGLTVTQEHIELAKEMVADFVVHHLGIDRDLFEIEGRIKSVASALEKEINKVPVEQQADRFALRIILKANQDRKPDFDPHKLGDKERSALLAKLGKLCFGIFGNEHEPGLMTEFGYLNEEQPWKDEFSPPFGVPGYKDYINNPKKNGYSSLHGRIILPIRRNYILFEIQVLDEIRHDLNQNGPGAHRVYKTKLTGEVFQEWFNNAAIVLTGGESSPAYTFVYDRYNQIIRLPGEATIEDFANAAGRKATSASSLRARIDNDNTFARRDPKIVYGAKQPLQTGDRVFLLG